jgi:hypothetical protein
VGRKSRAHIGDRRNHGREARMQRRLTMTGKDQAVDPCAAPRGVREPLLHRGNDLNGRRPGILREFQGMRRPAVGAMQAIEVADLPIRRKQVHAEGHAEQPRIKRAVD